MLISCEKCSTTYVLDDKLIPPQGAPVQCTRCGHVFTARAPQGTSTPGAAAGSTQMFGSPDASANNRRQFGSAAAQAPPASRTVMFGAPGSEAPAGNSGHDAPASSRTMMFGAGGTEAPAPISNKTVMFGAPGSEAPATGGSSPGSPASRTMMFGAGGTEAPAPISNKTVMFGAPGADAPATNNAGNRTMMFGAQGAEAPAAPAPAQGGAANKTMMFGAAGADGPVPQPSPPGQNPRSTVMFGSVPPQNLGGPTQPPPPRGGNTVMFGAPGAQTPPQQTPQQQKTSSTMMFGHPQGQQQQPQPPQQQKTSSTMMFGTPVGAQPQQPQQQPPSAQPQKSSSTMIFGATPVQAPGPGKSPKLTESTVRIGPDDLERMMREHESLQRGGETTPPASSAQQSTQERQNKTQLFAMQDASQSATPPSGNDSVSKPNKTQMFAMSDIEPPKKEPARRIEPKASQAALKQVDPSILDTFPPDAPRPKIDPIGGPSGTLIGEGPVPEDPNRGRMDLNQTVIDQDGPRVELPPEAPDLMQAQAKGRGEPDMASGSTQPMAAVEGDPAAALRAQVGRRNRVALIIIMLVIVGAALALTWKAFGQRLFARAPPAAAVEGCEKALSQLRFDDTKAKEEAVTQLTALVGQYPDFVEGHAALVTAVSLQVDDVQQRVRRIESLVDRKNLQIARYNKDKSPSNWEAMATTLSAQVTELIKEHSPLSDQAHALDTRAREAYKGLETAVNRVGEPTRQAKLAALRAQALFHGVSGTDQAMVLRKRYDDAGGDAAPDGWIDLAIPEYAANARVSEPLLDEALAKLEELHKRDSTFLRTYVLSARLHLVKKDFEAATNDLDQVLSMRKDHDVAAELREWVRKLPKADEKKE